MNKGQYKQCKGKGKEGQYKQCKQKKGKADSAQRGVDQVGFLFVFFLGALHTPMRELQGTEGFQAAGLQSNNYNQKATIHPGDATKGPSHMSAAGHPSAAKEQCSRAAKEHNCSQASPCSQATLCHRASYWSQGAGRLNAAKRP